MGKMPVWRNGGNPRCLHQVPTRQEELGKVSHYLEEHSTRAHLHYAECPDLCGYTEGRHRHPLRLHPWERDRGEITRATTLIPHSCRAQHLEGDQCSYQRRENLERIHDHHETERPLLDDSTWLFIPPPACPLQPRADRGEASAQPTEVQSLGWFQQTILEWQQQLTPVAERKR